MRLFVVFVASCSLAVSAHAGLAYQQPLNPNGVAHWSSWVSPNGTDADMYAYDNFTLAADTKLSEIDWYGGYTLGAPFGRVNDFTVSIYDSIAGGWQPDVVTGPMVQYSVGSNAGETLVGTYSGLATYSYKFTLPSTFLAKANHKYWVQIEASQPGYPDWGVADGKGGDGKYFNFSTGAARYLFYNGDLAFSLISWDGKYVVSATSYPANAGTITGTGAYAPGATASISATPNAGYTFSDWSEGGNPLWQTSTCSFTVNRNYTLVADFMPVFNGISVSPTSAVGGTILQGFVSVAAPAPANYVVNLKSSDPTTCWVQPTVAIPEGQLSGVFYMQPIYVAKDTTIRVYATVNGKTWSTAFIVQAPRIGSVAFTPVSVLGGKASTGTVALNGAAPTGGYTVTLASSSPAVTFPGGSSLTIPYGNTSKTFAVSTTPVAANTTVTVTATGPTGQRIGKMAVIAPQATGISFTPTTVKGGTTVVGATVTISGPAPVGGYAVKLASTNSAVASVPATVTVPAGLSTATFNITTYRVTANAVVAISASANGATRSKSLTVTP